MSDIGKIVHYVDVNGLCVPAIITSNLRDNGNIDLVVIGEAQQENYISLISSRKNIPFSNPITKEKEHWHWMTNCDTVIS